MAVKTKVKLDSLDELRKELNGLSIQREIGKTVVEEVKDFTSKGISAAEGDGRFRFQKYKDPKKYPGDKKPSRPVNLSLTGQMLDALEHWITAGRLFIGYRTKNVKAEAHNFGTEHMPVRRFLPVQEGSKFNLTIMKKIRDIYIRRIEATIKKGSR